MSTNQTSFSAATVGFSVGGGVIGFGVGAGVTIATGLGVGGIVTGVIGAEVCFGVAGTGTETGFGADEAVNVIVAA